VHCAPFTLISQFQLFPQSDYTNPASISVGTIVSLYVPVLDAVVSKHGKSLDDFQKEIKLFEIIPGFGMML
jgi:hypothetical protein